MKDEIANYYVRQILKSVAIGVACGAGIIIGLMALLNWLW